MRTYLRKIVFLKTKPAKHTLFSYFWHNLVNCFKKIYGLMAISIHNAAQNFIKLSSDRAKQFTFARSDSPKIESDKEIVTYLQTMSIDLFVFLNMCFKCEPCDL